MYGPLDGTTISSTLIDDMAEKHNGMFGKIVKEINQETVFKPMNGTVISLMFLTIAHNNASFVIAKKIMNYYDL